MLNKILILIILMSGLLFAQDIEEAANLSENEHGFGIKAAALGNAFAGIADDYSAIYWNPAGLAQIKMQQLYGSLNHLQVKTDATYLGNTTKVDQGFTKFQSFGYVYPFPTRRGSLVLALGYQRVKDLNALTQYGGYNTTSNDLAFSIYNDLGYDGLTLAFDRDFDLTQSIRQEGHLAQWSIGLAIDLAPNFSAGATFNLLGGNSDYRLKYEQMDTQGQNSYDITDENGKPLDEFYYNYYKLEQMVNTEYSGIQLKLGGLWKPQENLRIGATITFPTALGIDESWTYSDELSYDIHVLAEDRTYNYVEPYDSTGKFSYEIEEPFKFDLGIAYSIKNLTLAGGLRYVDWTQLKLKRADETPEWYESYFAEQNDRVPTLLRAVTTYSAGIQYALLNNTLQLRAGYRYVPSPFKDADKKVDKTFYSAGVGLRVSETTMIDIAVIHSFWEAKKYYRYDWDYDQTLTPMTTYEKYTLDKLQVGLTVAF